MVRERRGELLSLRQRPARRPRRRLAGAYERIGRPFWGQGLIPEAVRELLRYCFEDKGAQRVWCSHYAGNEKSKRVIEKCGFSYQLTCERPALVDDALRPTLFYALTKEKWEKTH